MPRSQDYTQLDCFPADLGTGLAQRPNAEAQRDPPAREGVFWGRRACGPAPLRGVQPQSSRAGIFLCRNAASEPELFKTGLFLWHEEHWSRVLCLAKALQSPKVSQPSTQEVMLVFSFVNKIFFKNLTQYDKTMKRQIQAVSGTGFPPPAPSSSLGAGPCPRLFLGVPCAGGTETPARGPACPVRGPWGCSARGAGCHGGQGGAPCPSPAGGLAPPLPGPVLACAWNHEPSYRQRGVSLSLSPPEPAARPVAWGREGCAAAAPRPARWGRAPRLPPFSPLLCRHPQPSGVSQPRLLARVPTLAGLAGLEGP